MTGIMCAMIACGQSSTGGGGGGGDPPLSLTLTRNVGSPVNVSSASGSIAAAFSYHISGGSGFYTMDTSAGNMTNNTAGKLGQGSPSTPPANSATDGTFSLTWSGFAVNEIQLVNFGCTVTDTDGAHTSAGVGGGVKRTS